MKYTTCPQTPSKQTLKAPLGMSVEFPIREYFRQGIDGHAGSAGILAGRQLVRGIIPASIL
jgi:hypothetical protein